MSTAPDRDPPPAHEAQGEAVDETVEDAADDVDAVLASASNAKHFPLLAAALAGSTGAALRRELEVLFAPQLQKRAPRRLVRVLCRLEGDSYEEPVLLTNISTSGVRFSVMTEIPLDVTHAGEMRLHVRTLAGPRVLTLALVRRCGGDDRYTDVACRFLKTDADHAHLVAEIRSSIFGGADAIGAVFGGPATD